VGETGGAEGGGQLSARAEGHATKWNVYDHIGHACLLFSARINRLSAERPPQLLRPFMGGASAARFYDEMGTGTCSDMRQFGATFGDETVIFTVLLRRISFRIQVFLLIKLNALF